MTISIIVITANPTEKQFPWKEALASYCDLADEVLVIDGGEEEINYPNEKVRVIKIPDPEVWNWAEHAKRLNTGLIEATGDWIIKCDIDWIFHDATLKDIRGKLSRFDTLVATFQKHTFYPKWKYIQKGEIPIAINKKFRDKIRFGKDRDTYTDLTYPITWQGEMDERGVPVGQLITKKDWGKTGEEFWNFDYTFSTLENMKKKWLRMSRSHKEYFGETTWGETEEEALKAFINNMRGKFKRADLVAADVFLPIYIRDRIKELTPEEFGYDGWGLLE